jgi:hypothetical protein
VGSNGSYLVSWQTAYQVAVERDHGRLTGNPSVIRVQSQDMVYELSLDILYSWGVGDPMLDDRRALD